MVTLVSHGNGTTGVRDYSLTDITKPGPLRWNQPMVSISFDDGWQSVYDRALPLLDEHGFRSTQYVNPSSIETPELHDGRRGAADAPRPGMRSPRTATSTWISPPSAPTGWTKQMRQSDEALAAAGLGTNDLAPPYGRSDPQVDWYASKYFDIVRGTDDGINTRQNLDPHDLKVFYVTDETTHGRSWPKRSPRRPG